MLKGDTLSRLPQGETAPPVELGSVLLTVDLLSSSPRDSELPSDKR